MILNTVNGSSFKTLVLSGYSNLKANLKEINELNVFPVPDGDTGTNMKKTYENGINSMVDSEKIGEVSDTLANGMLFGARGNSGVILSQYFRGIADYLKDKQEVDAKEMANAFVEGYKRAYSAVVSPTEGTILTVAREGINDIYYSIDNHTTINILLLRLLTRMKTSLKDTPDKLKVLKDAHVVDSGGAGLVAIIEGMTELLEDKKTIIDLEIEEDNKEPANPTTTYDRSLFNADSTFDYGYCTEFILQLLNSKCKIADFKLNDMIEYYKSLGNSIVAVQSVDIVKIHVHTKTPALVIEYAQKFGEFVTFKMENMCIQHNEILLNEDKQEEIPHKNTAVIAVCQGDGMTETFKGMNCDIVLNGGQTMNTSTEEFIEAFSHVNADNIIVLPNNKNIVLAAKQAKTLYKKANIEIVETGSMAEGYFAISMLLDDSEPIEEQLKAMKEGMTGVETGLVTYSIRDAVLNGVRCKKGDYIGILGKEMVASNKICMMAAKKLVNSIKNIKDRQIAVIFIGQKGNENDGEILCDMIRKKNPNIEVGCIQGDQDIYDYIFAIS